MSELSENLNYKEIQQLLLNYNNDSDAQKLRSYYYDKSILEIFAVSRRELSHSAFLAWLFDSNCNRDLGLLPLKKLFEIIIRRRMEQENTKSEIEQNLENAILADNLSISNIAVKTEEGVKKGRVDIVIESIIRIGEKNKKIKIIIENKVSTTEHSDQTIKYSSHYKNNKEESNIFVFLTPKPSIELDKQKEASCACKKFIEINYQDILNYILEPILKEENISEKTKFIISEYIQSLSVPALEENNDNNNSKKSIIMAMGEKETDLLTSFWEKNEKLIGAALRAISSNIKLPKDYRENANKMNEIVETMQTTRDDTKYFLDGDNKPLGKGRLVFEIVKHYTANNRDLTFEQLQKIFHQKLQGSTGVINTLKDVNDKYSESKKKRHFVEDDDILMSTDKIEFVVSTEWHKDNINNIIELAREEGYDIKEVKSGIAQAEI